MQVTQIQWQSVMGDNPAKFSEGWSAGLRPIENVSWDDVQNLHREIKYST